MIYFNPTIQLHSDCIKTQYKLNTSVTIGLYHFVLIFTLNSCSGIIVIEKIGGDLYVRRKRVANY
jgi:hypothetical protein